jgi:hypothetical protein
MMIKKFVLLILIMALQLIILGLRLQVSWWVEWLPMLALGLLLIFLPYIILFIYYKNKNNGSI